MLQELIKYVNPLQDIRALLALTRILRTLKPDLVHTHLAKAGILGRWAAKLNRIPMVVHTVHGPTFASGINPLARGCYWILEKFAASGTDCLIFVGEELCRTYVRAGICKKDKTAVIHTGRPAADFQAPQLGTLSKKQLRRDLCALHDPECLVLTIGRIVPSKQQDHAIRLLAGLIQEGWDARLVIVGEAFLTVEQDQRRKLQHLASELGVAYQVHFTGFRDDVLSVIQAADCVLLTSKYEGLPNVAIESRIAGTPFVSYDLCGVGEVIEHGRTGLIVPKNDPAALEAAVVTIHAGGLNCVKNAGEDRLALKNRFSINTMVEQTLSLYSIFWG